MNSHKNGIWYPIISAILFGASTPAAKYLLSTINPWLLAGMLYLGSSIGVGVVFILQSLFFKHRQEASLNRSDIKWLILSTLLGGMLAPIFLCIGLTLTSASSTSLFLNLEIVFTALCAWIIFKEHTSKRILLGLFFIVIGCVILSWPHHTSTETLIGPLSLSIACLLWAFDNNLTRKISSANPLQIAWIKNFSAGTVNTGLALWYGSTLPSYSFIFGAMIVGFLGYGMSLYFFILGLRYIGTARTSAYFSLAPFIGTFLAIIFLHEGITIPIFLAIILMITGILLHLTEKHDHLHQHEAIEHAHRHVHDEHHQHSHVFPVSPGEAHTHPHIHEPLLHSHPHFPDTHHRHSH